MLFELFDIRDGDLYFIFRIVSALDAACSCVAWILSEFDGVGVLQPIKVTKQTPRINVFRNIFPHY
ncbi:MAG: hypothetical protein HC907_36775 [Richelia sp. SM1_7_0]|nr:hypothetical protein [Richelia sp. SM1_7_0]